MNPQQVQQIQQMIQQAIAKNAQHSAFNLTRIPRHIHNDIDSPAIYQPVKTYIGSIGLNGDIVILPIGWSVTVNGTGDYTVTHGLTDAVYSVVVSPNFSDALFQVSPLQGSFGVTMFNRLNISQDTAFTFLMTVINNKNFKTTQYGGIQANQ